MQASTGALLLLALLCGAASAAAQEKDRPVSKVIALLKDMIVQMEKEAEEDEDIYETMGCWCETNDKQKTQAIADGKQRIESLTAAIEEFTGNSARLNTEIANLDKEVAKNSKALDEAQALRAKQNAEFVATEKDMLQSIGSMKGAITALSKHNKGASFIQLSDTQQDDILATVSETSRRHTSLLSETTTPSERAALKAFIQSGSLAPQSGEIFGILGAMKESFEVNLAAAQKTEAGQAQAFADLKDAKSAEIAAGTDQVEAKTQELANTDQNNAQSKTDLQETEANLDADTKFLADLKDKCANMDSEYEERTKTRGLEIAAVSKALEFLNSDEAHALFTKTFNPALLQLASRRQSEKSQRRAVSQVLRDAALASHDPRLSELAVKARMDAFGNLKKTISTMVERLQKEKDDEMKKKDFCVGELNKNAKETGEKTALKNDLDAKIAELTATIDNLNKDIAQLKAEVADLSNQLKMAGEDREKANKDFQVTVADQRATQKLLTTALDILKGFYEKAALLQAKARAEAQQEPAPAFKAYGKSKQSGGVMGMMQGIIDDAKALEAEALRGEEDSQKDYEEFVQDTNDSIEMKNKDIASKTEVAKKTEATRLDEMVELDHTQLALESLATEKADIHKNCDFLLKNYEVRTKARDQEMEALKQAIALFSGAKTAALLQNYY